MTRSATITAALFVMAAATPAIAAPVAVKNVVIVHGAFADGSGWRAVTDILEKDGFNVSIVQEPLTSLEEDVAATQRVLARVDGPVVLVGHSYGGMVITQAGNDPKVASLVYVAAAAPAEGETAFGLLSSLPAKSTGVAPTKDGYLFLDPKVFQADFAADVPEATTTFMALSEMPASVKAFTTPVTNPAWKTKPSYGIVSTQDRTINPDLERSMYKRAGAKVTEINASHAVFLSQPKAVAAVIEAAARATK